MPEFFDSAFFTWIIQKPGLSLVVILLALIARALAHRAIDRLTRRAETSSMPSLFKADRNPAQDERRTQRAQAVASLFKSIVTSVLLGITVLTVMAIFGIPIGPLLTSAGIAGVALGFGAQTLVKDYLAGISMILEDQFGVGDVIDLGDAVGTVETVGLRVTRLRSVDGTVWYVRNGEVVRVGNMSQNWSRAVVDVTVAPDQDLDRIQEFMHQEAERLYAEAAFNSQIIEEPQVWGIESISREGVSLRVVIKTVPLRQWDIARALRSRIMARFTQEGVRIPAGWWPTSMEGSDS